MPAVPPRRPSPWLLVEVDGSAASAGALEWALREAARREATVVAVAVVDDQGGDPLIGSNGLTRIRAAAQQRVDAQVLHAIAATGVSGRTRTAVVDRVVLDAMTAAAHGADLVLVGPEGKALLRQAVPRPLPHRFPRRV